MTRHDLVPLNPADFLRLVAERPEVARHRISSDGLPRWLESTSRRHVFVVGWREAAPRPWAGRQLICCLEAERAARGSLVHLSATLGEPVSHPVGQHLAEFTLRAWTTRRLEDLKREVGEARSGGWVA